MFKTYKAYFSVESKQGFKWRFEGRFRLDSNYLGMYARSFLEQKPEAHGVKFVDYKGAVAYSLYR